MLAYDYPLIGIFWTTVFVAFWAVLIYVVLWAFADIFRSRDLGGPGKVLWIILVVLVPVVGILAYVVAREHMRSEREFREAREQTLKDRSNP